jgi:uncharacterized protein
MEAQPSGVTAGRIRPYGDRTAGRRRALLATAVVIAFLAALNVGRSILPAGDALLSVAGAAALLIFARATGLTWAQLGLSRDRLRSGHRWAWAAVAVVAVIYVAGVLIPAVRPAFLDTRYHLGLAEALVTAFVVIPLGTVILEEVAFRSVLWGMLSRHMNTWRVVAVSSMLFGLWHVLPALNFAAARDLVGHTLSAGLSTLIVVLGTVGFTAVGGVVAAELRRRSGSLLASIGMHWATNGLGVLLAVVAWQMAG